MSSKNEKLIKLLRDIQLSCLSRLKIFHSNQLIGQDAAAARRQEIEDLELDLYSELILADELDYNEHQLLQGIVAVKITPTDAPDAFLEKFNDLMKWIRTEILVPLQERSAQILPSQWNQKMLDELLKVRRALRATKNKLSANQQDPNSDPDFTEKETEFTGLLASYRRHLRDNTVQANESAINTIKLIIDLIKAVNDTAEFISTYQMMNDFIASQIPATKNDDA